VGVCATGFVFDGVDRLENIRFLRVLLEIELSFDGRAELDDSETSLVCSNVESIDNVLYELLHRGEVFRANTSRAIEHEDDVGSGRVYTSCFQPVRRRYIVVDVTAGAIVSLPKLSLFVNFPWYSLRVATTLVLYVETSSESRVQRLRKVVPRY